jgi:hypothetical protein
VGGLIFLPITVLLLDHDFGDAFTRLCYNISLLVLPMLSNFTGPYSSLPTTMTTEILGRKVGNIGYGLLGKDGLPPSVLVPILE